MSRITRSRCQAEQIFEDESVSASAPADVGGKGEVTEPSGEERHPLTTVDGNSEEKTAPVVENVINTNEEKENATEKGKKGRKSKKGKKKKKKQGRGQGNETQGPRESIVEDDEVVETPEAVKQACTGLSHSQPNTVDGNHQDTVEVDDSAASITAAVLAAQEMLMSGRSPGTSVASATSEGPNKSVKMVTSILENDKKDAKEDVPVENSTMTELGAPSLNDHSDRVNDAQADSNQHDSFLDHISCRTPAKQMDTSEDSFKAMDDLEDAIEEVGKALTPDQKESSCSTNLQDSMTSPTTKSKEPEKTPSVDPKARNAGIRTLYTNKPVTRRPLVSSKPSPSLPAATLRQASTEEEIQATKKPIQRHVRVGAGGSFDKKTRPADKAQPPVSERPVREAPRVSRGPTGAVKSTKPPTRPTFELPGEALSRRKREQKEQQQQRELEEQQKRRKFEAKPVRQNGGPGLVVRGTTASAARARQSILGGRNAQPKPPSAANSANNTSSANSIITRSKRPSSIEVSKRPNTVNSKPKGPVVTVTRKPSLPSAKPRPSMATVKAPTTNPQAHGKKVFTRDQIEREELDRARKEKEAAAKRARAEAAERGRLQSRQWAEQQRRKMAAKEAAAKRMSAVQS